MKMCHLLSVQILSLISAGLLGPFSAAVLRADIAKAEDFRRNPAMRSGGSVIVQDRFGGQILGFDIDQASDEGVLTEYQTLDNGNVLAAIETPARHRAAAAFTCTTYPGTSSSR